MMLSETINATQVEDSSLNLQLRMQRALSNAYPPSQKPSPVGHLNPSNCEAPNMTSLHQGPLSYTLFPCRICVFVPGVRAEVVHWGDSLSYVQSCCTSKWNVVCHWQMSCRKDRQWGYLCKGTTLTPVLCFHNWAMSRHSDSLIRFWSDRAWYGPSSWHTHHHHKSHTAPALAALKMKIRQVAGTCM